MAEETQDSLQGIDTEALANFIQAQTTQAFQKAREENPVVVQHQEQPVQQQPQQDFWADIINPRIQPQIQQSQMAAAAAIDMANFYNSDEWDQVDDLLDDGDMTVKELKQEKAKIKREVEKTFEDMMKQGRGTSRAAILDYVMGKELRSNADTYRKKAVKRSDKTRQQELANARRGSDIAASGISSMGRDDIMNMGDDDFDKLWSGVTF